MAGEKESWNCKDEERKYASRYENVDASYIHLRQKKRTKINRNAKQKVHIGGPVSSSYAMKTPHPWMGIFSVVVGSEGAYSAGAEQS